MLAKLRVRAADAVRSWLRGPSRIDPSASISASAKITASEISGAAVISDHVRLHQVVLGGPVSIGPSSSLWGPGIYVLAKTDPIEIGNFCSIARDVSVHGYFHDHERVSTHYIGRNVLGRPIEGELLSKGPTRIGHDVWIGAGVHVMGGVSIGTGAIIGAGSVVTKDIPPYAVAVGAPARVIRRRFDDALVERLLESRWWEWSREEIRAKGGLFSAPVTPTLLDEYL